MGLSSYLKEILADKALVSPSSKGVMILKEKRGSEQLSSRRCCFQLEKSVIQLDG